MVLKKTFSKERRKCYESYWNSLKGIKRGHLSEEHKGKISAKNSGEGNGMFGKGYLRMGKNNPMYGKKHTEEAKKERRNYKHTEEAKGRISKNHRRCQIKETREKISKSHIGIKQTEESKKKISAALQGINLKDWKKFISFEPYNKSFNLKFKRAIRKRDNQVCMICGIHRERLNRALSIHHINYNKLMTIPQNCVSLCDSCHMKTNFNRKHWTKFFQDLLLQKQK